MQYSRSVKFKRKRKTEKEKENAPIVVGIPLELKRPKTIKLEMRRISTMKKQENRKAREFVNCRLLIFGWTRFNNLIR